MNGKLASVLATTALLLSSPALAQGMQGMDMGGMKMPAPVKKPVPKAKPRPTATPTAKAAVPRPTVSKPAGRGVKRMSRTAAPAAPSPTGNAMHATGHGAMPDMNMPGDTKAMPGMDMSSGSDTMPPMAMPGEMAGMAKSGTALAAGNAPAPAPPMDSYADRIYSPTEMQRARDVMMHESGAQKLAFVMFNLAEYQPRRDGDGFRWDGEAWYGGDINRLTFKSEGEGKFRGGVETADVQALYSRAIDPYFNLQAGVRQDLGKGPRRTYATIGFEGLAPYLFEVEGALFLSNKGEVLGRLEGYYDQRITQRLILQPRVELNLAAQDVPENRIGAGLSNAELGLRLRYEIRRQFAPYIGVSWDRKVGATARFARAAGEDATNSGIVAGVRIWF